MKTKIALEVIVNDSDTEELIFEQCSVSPDDIDIYWKGKYLGTVSTEELDDFVTQAGLIWLGWQKKKE